MKSPRGESPLYFVPAERRESIRAILADLFGASPLTDWRRVTGGVSGALILAFEARGRRHVLRLEPERIAPADRQRGFDCMTGAASTGAAPRLYVADAAIGLAVMDFVPARPLSAYPGGPEALARGLGALSARVREAPLFPDPGDYPEVLAGMLARLAASGLFAPGALTPHAEALARLRSALPWDSSARVSAHNDPNPRNVLFDGARLWLVDWELGWRNDPLVDLAIMSTDLAETPGLRDILLEAALGKAPDDPLRARLGAIQLLTRLFYGCVVLQNFPKVPPGLSDPGLADLTPSGFRAAVADGRLASGSQEVAYAFGRMSLTAFLREATARDFNQMLRMAAQA